MTDKPVEKEEHTTRFEEQPLSDRTMSRFRTRLRVIWLVFYNHYREILFLSVTWIVLPIFNMVYYKNE